MKLEPSSSSKNCSPCATCATALAATATATTAMKRRQLPNKKKKKKKKKQIRQQQQQGSLHELESLRSRVLKLEQFAQLQAARNDINTNMFVIMLNELSLKLNMKGRQREVKHPNSFILDTETLCQLKNSVEDEQEGQQNVKRVALRVLEAAAISLSGQTVTSRDDKTVHRLHQIQAFKLDNNVPINGMVNFKKNVTRHNQDAGLACDMTLSTVTDEGRNVCFGSNRELAEANGHLKAVKDMLDDIDIDPNLISFCAEEEDNVVPEMLNAVTEETSSSEEAREGVELMDL
tara:strand:+ start:2456 stop:3325 length:870 start_codon:yes stop_codon:yes gene_type:complete